MKFLIYRKQFGEQGFEFRDRMNLSTTTEKNKILGKTEKKLYFSHIFLHYRYFSNCQSFLNNSTNTVLLIKMLTKNLVNNSVYTIISHLKKFSKNRLITWILKRILEQLNNQILINILKSKKIHFLKKRIITDFSFINRQFLLFTKIIKDLIKKEILSKYINYSNTEHQEISRILQEKKKIYSLNCFYNIAITDYKKIGGFLKINTDKEKSQKNLFIIDSKEFIFPIYKDILYILLLNSILINKIIQYEPEFVFHKKQRIIKWAIDFKFKGIFNFVKKETFIFSIELIKIYFNVKKQLRFLKSFQNLMLKISSKFWFSIHSFDLFNQILTFFKSSKYMKNSFCFFKKNNFFIGKKILLDILIKFSFPVKDKSDKVSMEKIYLEKYSDIIIREVILSNCYKKFTGCILYLFSFKSLKKGLEFSWRIQLTKRFTDFFQLKLNQSIFLNLKILKFTTAFINRFNSRFSEEFYCRFYPLEKFQNHPTNVSKLIETFFTKSSEFSGLNCPTVLKHINRILAIGNFFLLTFLRTKKIIKHNKGSNKPKLNLTKNFITTNLPNIFKKKVRILLKNLDNSINYLEINNSY